MRSLLHFHSTGFIALLMVACTMDKKEDGQLHGSKSADSRPGTPLVIESASPVGEYSTVFEDDGETGYFYALDHAQGEQPIVDALWIYNVADMADKDMPSHFEIGWRPDGKSAILLINKITHAEFNFATTTGYSLAGSPGSERPWKRGKLEPASLR